MLATSKPILLIYLREKECSYCLAREILNYTCVDVIRVGFSLDFFSVKLRDWLRRSTDPQNSGAFGETKTQNTTTRLLQQLLRILYTFKDIP